MLKISLEMLKRPKISLEMQKKMCLTWRGSAGS